MQVEDANDWTNRRKSLFERRMRSEGAWIQHHETSRVKFERLVDNAHADSNADPLGELQLSRGRYV